MKSTFIPRFSYICLGMSLFIIPTEAVHAQGAAPQASNAPSAISQLASAFSGSLSVQSVELSGTASWYAGSLEDSGTATLTAVANGSSQMQLNLAATGQIVESQTGNGTSARCQWSGKDGISHNVDTGNCWRPVLWFLPAFSVQPSLLSSQQVFSDLGQGTVGSDKTAYRHLQGQLAVTGGASSIKGLSTLIQRTATDIGLDTGTALPAVLTYSVHPNDGASIAIAIEVHYSDYRPVDGVQIPFHIERYVNGSLQLDIRLTSAQIN